MLQDLLDAAEKRSSELKERLATFERGAQQRESEAQQRLHAVEEAVIAANAARKSLRIKLDMQKRVSIMSCRVEEAEKSKRCRVTRGC